MSSSSSSSSRAKHLFVFANEKAGMDAGQAVVSKEAAAKVILEASKDSRFFKNREEKNERVTARIEELLAAKREIETRPRLPGARELRLDRARRLLDELEAAQDRSRVFVVVDMDMFFAAVEMRDDPSLEGKPMAIGGMGMISTANYEARKYGVRSAMPGFIAVKLCPNLIFRRHRSDAYRAAAEQCRAVFRDYDPNFSSYSLDEASLEVTAFLAQHAEYDGARVAAEIRERILRETSLTCSAGIAPTRMLAKICADVNKPNGQFALSADEVLPFLADLPVRRVPGIGRVLERILEEVLDVVRVGQLRDQHTMAMVMDLFSQSTSGFLSRAAVGGTSSSRHVRDEQGHDEDQDHEHDYDYGDAAAAAVAVVDDDGHDDGDAAGSASASSRLDRKSVSRERTFAAMSRLSELAVKCHELCNRLAVDVERAGVEGRVLTLKMKDTAFHVTNSSRTLSRYIASAEDIAQDAISLLQENVSRNKGMSYRLMGVRLSRLRVASGKRPIADLMLGSSLKKRRVDNDGGGDDGGDDIVCPVCGKALSGASGLAKVNLHVENCLRAAERKQTQKQKKTGIEGFLCHNSGPG